LEEIELVDRDGKYSGSVSSGPVRYDSKLKGGSLIVDVEVVPGMDFPFGIYDDASGLLSHSHQGE